VSNGAARTRRERATGKPKRLRNVFPAVVQTNQAGTPVFPGALKNLPAGRYSISAPQSTAQRIRSERATLQRDCDRLEQLEGVAHSREGGLNMLGKPSTLRDNHLPRRKFLKNAGIATATAALGMVPAWHLAYGAALTKAQREQLTPDDIIALTKKGNQRFRLGKESPRDYLAQQKASAKGQYPAAVILSCIDSRAPAETIMDLGIGDCFNARVAGSIANDDILGSMEFACKVAGAKVVLVMGHTACGAIKGAIDNVQLGNLTGLLTKIRPAVEATQYQGERSANDYGFVDAVARRNVELTMIDIHRRSAVLADLGTSEAIKIAGAMYNLGSGVVDFLPFAPRL
jgi:carbonic anhydrase